jgi:hypothetical protein
MTQTNDSASPSHPSQFSLIKRMLIGATIGLALISFFVFGVDQPNPAWGKYWMIKPLIITPLAGAMCGLSNYIIMGYYSVVGLNRTVAMIISGVIFLIGLWMGIVLGLNGTMWN